MVVERERSKCDGGELCSEFGAAVIPTREQQQTRPTRRLGGVRVLGRLAAPAPAIGPTAAQHRQAEVASLRGGLGGSSLARICDSMSWEISGWVFRNSRTFSLP